MLPEFKRGWEWLQDNRPFFSVLVMQLGTPVHDPQIDTACVRLRRIGPNEYDFDTFEFAVNEDFLSNLTDEEVAGVISHEGFHILFDHLGDFSDDYLENEKKRVLSQECICNDNIVHEGIQLPDLRLRDEKGQLVLDPDTGKPMGGLIFGPDIVGHGVAGWTTREVYDLITDEKAEEKMPDSDLEKLLQHLGDLDDESAEKLKDAIKQGIKEAIANGDIEESDLPMGEDVRDALDIDGGISKKAGTSGSQKLSSLSKQNVTMEWAKYIAKIDPAAFLTEGEFGSMRSSWHAPRRKLTHMVSQGVRLPVQRPKFDNQNFNGGMKPHIVLALDFSGSIPDHYLDIMSSLAGVIPSSINVSCCTFSTEYVPFDPKLKRNQQVAYGGTDFGAIVSFVDSLKLKRYPSVVVITDGQASLGYRKPDQKLLDKRWNWLLIDKNDRMYDSNVSADTVKYLHDYISSGK